MREDNLHRLVRGTLVSTLILLSLLLVSLSPLLPRVQAAATPGVTDGLVNLGQPTRESSSAVPVVGFSMTANTAGWHLLTVVVTFSGSDWQPGDDRDLRKLDRDPLISGVGIFRDDGTANDALDATDTPVVMAAAPTWAGNDVRFDFTGTSESFPTTANGYQWIIIIRTSANRPADLIDGETIRVTIRANAIVATDGANFVTQPAGNVIANDLTVDLTNGVDMVPGSTAGQWIGPATAQVNSKAVAGIHLVDGGQAVNRGIQDSITSLTFRLVETGGAISSGDFQAMTTSPATSGIALYQDNGVVADAWDASDTALTPATITPTSFPSGGATITMTFSPGIDVPNSAAAGNRLDFFLVVRTNRIVTGDTFRVDFDVSAIHIRGLLAGAVDGDLRVPSNAMTTSDVLGDATPPQTRNEAWIPSSNYLFASGLDLHFGHAMPSLQLAAVEGDARDDDSGLAIATFTAEPSLASSPAPQTLSRVAAWERYSGAYGFDATSLATNSPADVTICDLVGNCISTSQEGKPYRYIFEASKVIVLPDPGWSVAGSTQAFWIDPSTGKLWFSNLIAAPSTATLQVQVASLSGAELVSISASAEPTLGGPTPASQTFPVATFNSPWSTSYNVDASAQGTSAPVTLTALDNLGNAASVNFDYGLDTLGPSITITNPGQGAGVGGNTVAKATVVEGNTKVRSVQFSVDTPTGPRTYAGFFDGISYFTPISTADFPDGKHRITVTAWDMVGNQNTVAVDVTFSNAPADTTPPAVNLLAPIAGSYVQGQYTIVASATDNNAVAAVNLTLRRASDGGVVLASPLALGSSGYYQATLDTLGLNDGAYQLTVSVKDTSGLVTTSTVNVQVDNHAPALQVASPTQNAYVSGSLAVSATAQDAFLRDISYSVDGSPWTPTTTALDTAVLADGRHTLTVRATDLSGRATSQDTAIIVDNTAPTGRISSLASGQTLRGVYTFRVFAWDAVGIGEVTLAVAGQTVNMVYNPQTGYYEYSVDTAALADGSYTAQATITDLSGKRTATVATPFQTKNQPQTDYVASVNSILPVLSFLFLLLAFVVILLLLKTGAIARWVRPRAAPKEMGGRDPGMPPRGLPPPGTP